MFYSWLSPYCWSAVLIVAECNVNELEKVKQGLGGVVLIVAECNVNRVKVMERILDFLVLIVAECNVNTCDS